MATLVVLLLVTDERTPVTGFFDLPVTGGTATYEMLSLQPEERGHAIALLAREMFTQSASALERAVAVRNFVAQLSMPGNDKAIAADSRPLTIAAPLTADHWRDAMELPDKADLFGALISNRSALLVCAGAMAADPSMRALLDRDRGLLRWIVKTAPAAFWIAARDFRIEKDRVIVPGGAAAEPIWEALVEVKVTKPADFIRALLARDSGRLAWFYDTIATMSPERMTAAFGAPPIRLQIEEARAFLQRVSSGGFELEARGTSVPARHPADPWIVSSQIDLLGSAVAPPAEQWFWETLFDRSEITRRSAASLRSRAGVDGHASRGWLRRSPARTAKERRDRFDMIRFAQGVFKNVEGDRAIDALIALGGYRRYRAVLMTLDRMEITTPRVYARARRSGADVG